jgi:hypothetical protein
MSRFRIDRNRLGKVFVHCPSALNIEKIKPILVKSLVVFIKKILKHKHCFALSLGKLPVGPMLGFGYIKMYCQHCRIAAKPVLMKP